MYGYAALGEKCINLIWYTQAGDPLYSVSKYQYR